MKKIVVIGPESTGKSMLCEKLAAHYQTNWVKEYAREYLLQHGKDYSFEDLLTIAKGQIEGEDSIAGSRQLAVGNQDLTNHNLLFIDTDLYVMKVWSEFVFGKCHHWILNRIVDRKYDLYLLCHPDLPWVKDELREYPDQRTREILFRHYKDIMVNQGVPWVEIKGNYAERLDKAVEAVAELMDKG